ncbi:MAG TPA: DUF2071 domain-containing protein [Bacteroidales bacterium]|nr:DUF2071 domain-containing protein [Bacteroidales bacterium]
MSINEILGKTSHRPFPLPGGSWSYYQEWHSVLFAHWMVPSITVKKLIPAGLDPDLYNGEGWVSLVGFRVKEMHPNHLPAFPPFSDFYEINMRTYVKRNEHPGIYFLSLEAQKAASAFLGRTFTGLNYLKSDISYSKNSVQSDNLTYGYRLKIGYVPGMCKGTKTMLDKWLTDRYTMFHELKGGIYGHNIHHVDWPLRAVRMEEFEIFYNFNYLIVDSPAVLYHYSDGVQVPTWRKIRT